MTNEERQVFSLAEVPVVRPPQVQQSTVSVDLSGTNGVYTNWYRVVGTPEEVIVDFGLRGAMQRIDVSARRDPETAPSARRLVGASRHQRTALRRDRFGGKSGGVRAYRWYSLDEM